MLKQGDMNDYALPFAAWDLRLYLDTHPCDERAFAAYKQLCAAAGEKCSYACSIGAVRGLYDGCGCEENETTWSGVSRIGGGSCGCDGAANRRENGNSCGCDSANNRRANGDSFGCNGVVNRRGIGGSCGCDGIGNRREGGNSCGCDGVVNRRGNGDSCGCDGLISRLENDGSYGCDSERVWHWVDGPWPWELAANIIGGDC